MRIISDYHDYYDSIQLIDEERDVIWKRKEETIVLYDNYQHQSCRFPLNHIPMGWSLPFNIGRNIVGFCGKTIPLIRLSLMTEDTTHVVFWCYSPDQVFESLDRLSKKDKKKIQRSKSKYIRSYESWINEFFVTIPDIDLSNEFIEYKVPVFRVEWDLNYGEITKNPCLRDLNFYTQYDTMQTYQEIAMFYSGVLGDVNEKIPPVSNSDMIQAKGFDIKISFRKPKGK